MRSVPAVLAFLSIPFLAACGSKEAEAPSAPPAPVGPTWKVNFFDNFDTFDEANWQDQILWVNSEHQCYLRGGELGTREVSDGTLKLRVINVGEPRPCDNLSKTGEKHPDTPYVSGRITTKNRQEFVQGRWTARLRVLDSGAEGMFPAWWLLGASNNEPPVQQEHETVCWPLPGSGEIDIFEHYGGKGEEHYVSRIIENLGHCDGGDWQTHEKSLKANLREFHEYSVEWQGEDLVFAVDGVESARIAGRAKDFQEPMFAILNFGKITQAPMEGPWVMEVDWVKHESLE